MMSGNYMTLRRAEINLQTRAATHIELSLRVRTVRSEFTIWYAHAILLVWSWGGSNIKVLNK